MFITDKLTEIAIAICNEFRHWVWVFPHHSFDLLDVASSQLSSVVLFYYYFFSFSVFFFCGEGLTALICITSALVLTGSYAPK